MSILDHILVHTAAEFVGGLTDAVAAMPMLTLEDFAGLVTAADSAPTLLIAGTPATQEAIDALVVWRDTHP